MKYLFKLVSSSHRTYSSTMRRRTSKGPNERPTSYQTHSTIVIRLKTHQLLIRSAFPFLRPDKTDHFIYYYHNPSARHTIDHLSLYRPATILAVSLSAIPFVCPPPTIPETVFCISVHSVSLGIPISPISYTYSRPSLPPNATRRPSLRSHSILLIALPVPTLAETAGTYIRIMRISQLRKNTFHTSVSLFKFQRSNCPEPSTVPNSAGCAGCHLTSYT